MAAPDERTIDEGDDMIAKLCPARNCMDKLQKLYDDALAGRVQFYRDSLPISPLSFYIDTYGGAPATDSDLPALPSFVGCLSQ